MTQPCREPQSKEFCDLRHDHLEKRLEERLDRIAEDVARMRDVLIGEGDATRSLVVRVVVLEQDRARREWLVRTAIAASLTSIVAVLLAAVKSSLR